MNGARLRTWRSRRGDQCPSYDELLSSVRVHHPAVDAVLLQGAYAEAARWHQGHLRRSGAPVLAHCVTVAAIVAECGMPPDVVCAALLHDLEDTDCPPERVAELFGPYIADLLRAIPTAPLDMPSAAALGIPGDAPSFEAAVLAIRLADRLHNMRTIAFLSQAARYRRACETVDVFAPLAHAAGLHHVSRELHHLASAVLRSPVASYAVTGRTLALLALLLPSRQRSRWQEEWTAELVAHRTRRTRARYTLRVLWHTPRLSLALRRPVEREQS
ncbi:HD domain-containing protein [Streptomyces sp. NBC_00568]|nr:HD domain-containing protein [Streptomyces sp. NBC_00568]MCX4993316.1 HD domain-containing protein [Streptomyces sp. NBC_00568]MCX5009253.1 HD domain-containing protein [Streptomyces sp. NBC_00638]